MFGTAADGETGEDRMDEADTTALLSLPENALELIGKRLHASAGRDSSGDAFDVDVYRLPTDAIHVDVSYAPLIGESPTDEHSLIELRAMCAVVAAYDKIDGAEHAREKRVFGRLASDVCRALLMQTHTGTGEAGEGVHAHVVAAHWYMRDDRGGGASGRQLYKLATGDDDPALERKASRLVANAEAIVEMIFAG